MTRVRLVGFLAVLVLSPAIVWAQTAADTLPTDPALKIGTLPNGLRYYVRAH